MSRVVTTTFGVGQGLCVLVEIYDNNGLAYLALVDCGTDSPFKRNRNTYTENISEMFTYITEKAGERFARVGYYFDAVFISHQDKDHRNLLIKLLVGLLGLNKDKRITVQDGNTICTQYMNERKNFRTFTSKVDCSLWLCYMNQCGSDEYNLMYSRRWINVNDPNGFEEVIDISAVSKEYRGDVYARKSEKLLDITYTYNTTCASSPGITASLLINLYSGHILCWIEENKVEIEHFNAGLDLIKNIEEFLMIISGKCGNNPFHDAVKTLLKQNGKIGFEEAKEEIYRTRPKKKVIKEVYFGGCQYGSQAKRFKVAISNLAYKVFEENCHKLKKTPEDIQFIVFAPIGLYVEFREYNPQVFSENLSINTLQGIGIQRNASSMFVLLKIGSCGQIIFPGDATVHTMFAAIRLKEKGVVSLLPSTQLLIAPHHGSDVTSTYNPKQPDYNKLAEFLRMVNPENIYISSGIQNDYFHPGKNFVDKAVQYTGNGHLHYIYKYLDGEYIFDRIAKNVFTTVVPKSDDNPDVNCAKYQSLPFSYPSDTAVEDRIQERREKPKMFVHRELPPSWLFI